MNKPLRSLISVATLILAAASPLAAQTVEIKPRWPVGKKFTQTMVMDQSTTMSLGEQKMEQKVAMTMDTTIGVKAHENGKFKRVSVKYDRVAMDMSMAGQQMKYDSSKPADPTTDPLGIGKSLGVFIGKEVKFTLDDKEEVLEVENLDAMIKEMTAANPMAAMFGQIFSKDALKNMMKQATILGTPGKPVKAGDKWPFTFSSAMPPMGTISMTGDYTMKGMADRGGAPCAELAVTSKIAIDATKTSPGDGGANLQALGLTATEGSSKGTVWFDPALGICRDAEMTQEINLSMKNPQKPDESITIPMKQVVKQTITKVENL